MRQSLLILLGFSLTFCFELKAQSAKELFLLPNNYEGKVVIVYNRPFGNEVKVSKDSIYYKVPSDGVAIVTSQLKDNLEDGLFYQVDSSGRRLKLDILSLDIIMASADSTRLKNQTGIFIFGTIGSCNPNESESFCYSDFYVGSLKDMAKYYTPDKSNEFMLLVEKKAKWSKQ